MAVTSEVAMLAISLIFVYALVYQRHKFLGGIIFFIIGMVAMMQVNIAYSIGIIAGSVVLILMDLLAEILPEKITRRQYQRY